MSCSVSLETLQARLTEAEAAYHRLLTGASTRVVVDQNGERVEFTSVSAGSLFAYIVSLKQQIAALSPACAPPINRPIGFLF